MTNYRQRSREFPHVPEVYGTSYTDFYPYGEWEPLQSFSTSCYGGKTEWETCMDELHAGPPYKTGGPFDKTREATNEHIPRLLVDHVYWAYRYAGAFLPAYSPMYYLQEYYNFPVEWGDVTDYGATGWNKYRPTKPSADAGVFAGEFHEVPLMFKSLSKNFARSWRSSAKRKNPKTFDAQTASGWLAINFGWLPFIRDLRSFVQTAIDLDKRLKQLERDNGKWVRRGGPVRKDEEEEQLLDQASWGFKPVLNTYLINPSSSTMRRTITSKFERDVWFSARFRYYMPSRMAWVRKSKWLSLIFGLNPSPSLIYELTPWSWLIDWCSNTGDVLQMLSSMLTEDLCAKYAYVMGHTKRRVTVTGRGQLSNGINLLASWEAIHERKQRVPASEFGFGLTRDNFSARQWSILGALGLSRL